MFTPNNKTKKYATAILGENKKKKRKTIYRITTMGHVFESKSCFPKDT